MTTRPHHPIIPTQHPHPQPDDQPGQGQPAETAVPVEAVPRSQRLWAVPGFARRTMLPLAGFAAALAAVTVVARHWQALIYVVAVLPVAVVVQWALTTHRAALAGAPVHPAAARLAMVVMGLVTLAMAALIVTVAIHPAALTQLDALLRGGTR